MAGGGRLGALVLVALLVPQLARVDTCRRLGLNEALSLERAVVRLRGIDDASALAAAANDVHADLFPVPGAARTMFLSALWLPDRGYYLSAVRVYVPDACSAVYLAAYDLAWQPLEGVRIGATVLPGVAAIPLPSGRVPYCGPEDPRLFVDGRGRVQLLFSMLDGRQRRRMFLFTPESGNAVQLRISGADNDALPAQKNWTALVLGRETFFAYSHASLSLLRWDGERTVAPVGGSLPQHVSQMRGGSPLVRVALPDEGATEYHVGFAYYHHARLRAEALYRASLVLVHVPGDDPRRAAPVYYSEPLDLARASEPAAGDHEYAAIPRLARVSMVVSVARWLPAEDAAELTLNHNDDAHPVLRVRGLVSFVAALIAEHRAGRLAAAGVRCAAGMHARYHAGSDGVLDRLFRPRPH